MSVTRGTTMCFARCKRPPLGVRDDELERGDRQALTDAGSFVDFAIGSRLERHFLHDLAHVVRNLDAQTSGTLRPRFLPGDRHGVLACRRVVRADLRADAILERRDDFAARRVVFRVRGEHQHHVEFQADGVALDLDVAFLKDVEQTHLDFAREIRQLVDRENPAIGPRKQPVVHGQLVGEVQARPVLP